MTVPTGLLQNLAQSIGTPYYCYDGGDIRARFRQLRATLPSGIGYLYSLKANPNKALVEILRAEGAGCEVCSGAELEIALAAGVSPQRLVFVGPAKSVQELTRCIELRIRAIVIESLHELLLVERIASSRGAMQPVALRINPAFQSGPAPLVMGGKPTQFGIDAEQLGEAMSMLRNCKHVVLAGIHVYLGTRILNVMTIRDNTQGILELAARVAEMAGRELAFVDVGGGFGVNYFQGEAELDLSAVGTQLRAVVEGFRRRCPSAEILIELGRYLVAPAGVFVTAVRYVKHCRGKQYAICDGGSNCHATAAGIGSLFRRNFPLARLIGSGSRGVVYTVTGPLCTPTDVIGEEVTLPELAAGDLIGIYHSGAYGPSASPVYFLGFGHPAELLYENGTVRLIRHRTTIDEILASHVAVPVDLPLMPPQSHEAAERSRACGQYVASREGYGNAS
jgi:diaminopimelate decarboxylase